MKNCLRCGNHVVMAANFCTQCGSSDFALPHHDYSQAPNVQEVFLPQELEVFEEPKEEMPEVMAAELPNVLVNDIPSITEADMNEDLFLKQGTNLRDTYVIGQVVGAGGFGTTYSAWDNAFDRKVAIKEYLPAEFATRVPGKSEVLVFNDTKKQKQFHDGFVRFLDEGKRIKELASETGIIHVYDVFEANNTAYLVMEFIDGRLLEDEIGAEDTYITADPYGTIEFMQPLIRSIQVLHDARIHHLDIAPNNVLISSSGQAKFIDYAAYRHVTTSHSRSLSVIVKPGYSPEELYRSAGDLGPHTDVYAIGALLYRMLTGIAPPDAMARRMNLEKGKSDPLKPIRKYNRQVTKSQENAILNALNVRIEDRTPNVMELSAELESPNVKRKGQKVKFLDIGKWPIWAKASSFAVAASIMSVVTLMAMGIIGFPEAGPPPGMVRVPHVINQPVEQAEAQIDDRNLIPLVVGREFSAVIPAGLVLVQDRPGGIFVEVNSIIGLTASGGQVMALVPFVEGLDEETATEALIEAGFEVRVMRVHNQVIREGSVLSQSVEGGTAYVYGGTVWIEVSAGRDPFSPAPFLSYVPLLEGLTFSEAMEAAYEAGFMFGDVTRRHGVEPVDTVVSQSLVPGTPVMTDVYIDLVVSLGGVQALVPDVRFASLEEAERMLLTARFVIEIVRVRDELVARDVVVNQYPVGNVPALQGSTVRLYVSDGGTPFNLIDVSGMTHTEARAALTAAGLVVRENFAFSAAVADGRIMSQSPGSGSAVVRGDVVYITISSGEQLSDVPNVVGMQESAAVALIRAANLRENISRSYHDYIAEGVVISQLPLGGVQLPVNTVVNVEVSRGPQSVTIPSGLVGTSVASAQGRLEALGLVVVREEQHHGTIALGNVIALNPASGTLHSGASIRLYASLGPEILRMPDVVRQTRASAVNTLTGARYGFTMNPIAEDYHETIARGSIMRQHPLPNAELSRGSAVTLTESLGPPPDRIITFAENGGTGSMAQQTTRHNTHFTLPANGFTPPANHSFVGWNTTATTTASHQPGQTMFITENITLHAIWANVPSFTITYSPNGGGGTMAPVQVAQGSYHIVLPNSFTPPAPGTEFIGWNTVANGTGESFLPGARYPRSGGITGNRTLHAQWRAPNVEVRLYPNPGPVDVRAVIPGQNLILPTLTRELYVFLGWNTDSGGGGTMHPGGSTLPNIQTGLSLWAQWRRGEPPVITGPSSADGTGGQGGSVQITATGDPTSWSLSGAPTGVTISSGGLLSWTSGTPAGRHSFSIAASNQHGTSPSFSFTLNLEGQRPGAPSPGSASGQAGTAGSQQINASGATSFTLVGAPAGASINNSGLLSWTAATPAGVHNFTVRASNQHGDTDGPFTLTLTGQGPGEPSPGSATGQAGTVGSQQINSSGATSFTLVGAPTGVSINNSGLLSWTAATPAGTHNFTVRATNQHGSTDGPFTLTLTGQRPSCPITLSGSGNAGTAGSVQINAPDATSFALVGAPSGVSINNAGVLSWTAATPAGTHNFTIRLSNQHGDTECAFTLTLAGQPPGSPSPSSASGQAGSAGSVQINASGATSFTLVGAPSGVSINNSGLLSWTAAADAGTHNFTVRASNQHGDTDIPSFTLTLTGIPPSSPSPSSGSGDAGFAGSVQINASGATSFTLVGAPSGVSINNAGVLSWTAGAAAGTHSFTVRASNQHGDTDGPFTLTLAAVGSPPVITGPHNAWGFAGDGGSVLINATENPTSFALSGAPGGVSITGGGSLSWTGATPAGDWWFSITATNAYGTSPSFSFNLYIAY